MTGHSIVVDDLKTTEAMQSVLKYFLNYSSIHSARNIFIHSFIHHHHENKTETKTKTKTLKP